MKDRPEGRSFIGMGYCLIAGAELVLRDTRQGLLDVVTAAGPRVVLANGAKCWTTHLEAPSDRVRVKHTPGGM